MDNREKIVQAANQEAGMELLDWPALKVVCLSKEPLIRKLLNLYVNQAPQWKEELRDAVAGSDSERAREICHTIEGAAAAINATASVDFLKRLHQLAHEEKLVEAQESLNMAISVIDQTCELFKRMLGAGD